MLGGCTPVPSEGDGLSGHVGPELRHSPLYPGTSCFDQRVPIANVEVQPGRNPLDLLTFGARHLPIVESFINQVHQELPVKFANLLARRPQLTRKVG